MSPRRLRADRARGSRACWAACVRSSSAGARRARPEGLGRAMSRPEPPGQQGPEAFDEAAARSAPRYGHAYARYMGVLGVLLIVLLALNTALSKHNGASGIEPGRPLPPFAVPLATGSL